MEKLKIFFCFLILLLIIVVNQVCYSEEDYLRYFLSKVSSGTEELSKKERIDLLNQINLLLGKVQKINTKLISAIQSGELGIKYQEGRLWMSKLESDSKSIEIGIEQIVLLKEKPDQIQQAIKLYKSLRDISSNFSHYNNIPSFSGFVGDVAPEIGLWVDPIFYKLYLLPLARLKDISPETPQKERKTLPKGKRP